MHAAAAVLGSAALPRDCVTACMWVTGLAGPGPGVISTVSTSTLHTSTTTTAPEQTVLCCWLKVAGKNCGWCGVAGLGLAAATLQIFHMKVAYNICVPASSARTAPRLGSTAHTHHLTHPRPTRPADTSAGAKQYFVFAIKYFLIALNKSAPGPMSVSIPGWCGPGGAAGRAVTQIRARVRRPGRRGPQLRPARPPAGQLRSGLSQQSHTSSHFYFSSFILVHAHSPTLGPRPDVTQGWSSPCSLPWR